MSFCYVTRIRENPDYRRVSSASQTPETMRVFSNIDRNFVHLTPITLNGGATVSVITVHNYTFTDKNVPEESLIKSSVLIGFACETLSLFHPETNHTSDNGLVFSDHW